MLVAILADIHGNLPALNAVLADIARWQVDAVLVAGDVIGGTQSPQVIERLRSIDSLVVRGNREEYLLTLDAGRAPRTWYVGAQWAGLRRMHRQLASDAIDYLASLPPERTYRHDGAPDVRVVHGRPGAVSGLLVPEGDPATVGLFRRAGLFEISRSWVPLKQAMSQLEEKVLVCGHTHIPWVQRQGSKLALNPGSVGMPINGHTRAQYALLAWRDRVWQVRHRAVTYDLEPVWQLYQENERAEGWDAFGRASLLCILTGHNIPGKLVLHGQRLASLEGYTDLNDASDTIWDRAISTFDWEFWEAIAPGP